jgi:hypothetical protein
LHDAYVLAEFVGLMPVERVCLASSSEQWPDGYVKLSGKTHNIEVTSTHGGRRLGKEYREVKAPTLDPVSNWIARAESIPRYLDKAIDAKSRKRYGSACWLVVYLNINEYDIRQKETELVIRTIKARYAASFEAISVLWKQQGEIALTEAELYAAQFDASAYVDVEPCRKGFVIVLSFRHFRCSLDANKRKGPARMRRPGKTSHRCAVLNRPRPTSSPSRHVRCAGLRGPQDRGRALAPVDPRARRFSPVPRADRRDL